MSTDNLYYFECFHLPPSLLAFCTSYLGPRAHPLWIQTFLQEEQRIINALEAGKAKSDHSPRSEISLKCWALCIKRPRCLCFALGTLQERAEQLCEAAAVPLGTWHSTRQRRPAFSSSRAFGNTGVGLRQMQWWWNELRFDFFQVSRGYGDASLMPWEFAASKGDQEQVSEGFWQRLTVQHVKPVSS